VTGVSWIATALVPKRLELLHQMARDPAVIGALVNPGYPEHDLQLRELEEAGAAVGQKINILRVATGRDVDTAFTQQRVSALIVANDPFFLSLRDHIVALAARHAIPAIYYLREFAVAGGLMSYGASLTDANRQGGVYTGRILKGARPADLPVWQPTRFELIINLRTAKAIGIDVPPTLLATADEVIE